MKRDPDLIRKILFAIEKDETPSGPIPVENMGLSEYPIKTIYYQVKLLAKAGYIDAVDITSFEVGNIDWIPYSLTWIGHDFIDAARSDELWGKTKSVLGKAGGFTMD